MKGRSQNRVDGSLKRLALKPVGMHHKLLLRESPGHGGREAGEGHSDRLDLGTVGWKAKNPRSCSGNRLPQKHALTITYPSRSVV